MKKITKYLLPTVCLLLLLTGCNNSNNNTNEVNNNNQIEKKGHTLNSSIGTFIVDKDGSVYYENYDEITYMGMPYKLTAKDLYVLGTKKEHKNYTYQSEPLCNLEKGCTVEAYKLNLTNVSSAYEVTFGNGGASGAIIFLTYDGKVHELSFRFYSENKIELTTDVSKYPNIVSVVKNMQFGGHGAMLIDANGNKYDYTESTK